MLSIVLNRVIVLEPKINNVTEISLKIIISWYDMYNLTPEEQKELTNSWRKFWKKGIFDCPNHSKHHLSSLSKRKMEGFDHVKIIGTSMIGRLKMHTLYL
jgi:hypothetical protein